MPTRQERRHVLHSPRVPGILLPGLDIQARNRPVQPESGGGDQ